ncbi:MAG TPA: enoyl-CoA hydratase/isomerase family protein [Xanthomonadales bacterium]|nr:enoyl-CoA hydratase/isomerase family protein [Xanthomonadales bacterium]
MISLTIESHVATVVLDRPPVNAINHSFVDSLNQILGRVECRQDVSVLHIRSVCKAFCAGADLALMEELVVTPEGCDAMVDLIRQLQRVLDRLERMSVVTVAEMSGAALGGGLELALACDLRVCSETAKLGLPEASLGLLPGAGGTQRLPRVCGEAVARRLILGAEVVSGKEAVGLGLVQWAVPADQLPRRTQDLVARLAMLPRQALAACKRCMAEHNDGSVDGYDMELAETRTLYGDDNTRKRLQAFLQKTKQTG